MRTLILTLFTLLTFPKACFAEMLQVSADGSVLLSTESIEVRQNSEGKYVTGKIYVIENGKKSFSPFTTTCSQEGGYIAFQKPDSSFTKPRPWSFKGNLSFDTIAGTACRIAKLVK